MKQKGCAVLCVGRLCPQFTHSNKGTGTAAFASQSLLTGLGSVQFITNLGFVVGVLKERVPRRCVLATFLIVAGNVILVIFGSKDSPDYSVAQLAALYRQDSMAAYMMLAYAGGLLASLFQIFSMHNGHLLARGVCILSCVDDQTVFCFPMVSSPYAAAVSYPVALLSSAKHNLPDSSTSSLPLSVSQLHGTLHVQASHRQGQSSNTNRL